MILVLWDIDRTLLYVGDTDRLVYRAVFEEVVGRPAEALPAKGTGVTMPLAVRELLQANGVPDHDTARLTQEIIQRLPHQLSLHREHMLSTGTLMPGSIEALTAVRSAPHLVPSVVTGNLKASAETKLTAFGLSTLIETGIGAYASDDPHRPALVPLAQQRARAAHRHPFTHRNTVIIGDSLQDVRTGREGGAKVIAVASGTTPATALADAGADHVLADLTQPDRLPTLITRLCA
ncbi:HAD family hydrolase [Streptomyces sp. NPDC055078]